MNNPSLIASPSLSLQRSTLRNRRLRARRIRVEHAKLGAVVASARHSALGSFEATVEDLSLHGVALVISGSEPALVLSGDRLEELRVVAGGAVLYEGSAIVRRMTESEDRLVVGVELSEGGLDLGVFYRVADRYSFAERLRGVERQSLDAQVSPAFKAWVADVRTYLETMRQFLDAEEQALASLDLLTRQQALSEYLGEAARAIVVRMNRAAEELATFARDLSTDEDALYRAFLRRNVLPLITCSPLLRRAYEKPLGYAGDYEVMNMLYRDHAEGETLFAKAMNMYGAQEAAAQANINRLEYLGRSIRQIVDSCRQERVRVASIGCGPARELLQILSLNPELGPRLDVALVDQEERAITYCERTLGPVAAACGARCRFIRESVRRLLVERQLSSALGVRDVIYSAGLFDYLNHRTFSALLAVLYGALDEEGTLIIGNVASHNPTRAFMEYYLDWFLIHRSPENLLGFAHGLNPPPRSATVDAEPLGVNLFLTVKR